MFIFALVSLVSSQFLIELNQPKDSFRSFVISKLNRPLLKGESKLYNHKEFYYSGFLQIGSPLQNFSLIIDSGSSVIDKQYTWVEKFNCSECSSFKHQFNPSESKSYSSQNKSVRFSYGDGSWAEGTLSKDFMSIGDVNGLAANAYFVLAEHDNMTSASDSDGLLGLAFNTLSDGYDTLVDSLFKVGAIKKRIFALYLNRLGQIGDKEGYGEKPSSLEIGTYNIKKYADADSLMITQDIEKSSGFWKARVNFEFMDLELKQVPVIYDSGTTLVIVDQNSYMNMFEYLIDSHTCVDYGLIICECGSRDDMPSLKFYIKGHKLEIPADRAWYSEGKYCMLLVQQANIDFWILGSLFLQNFYTIHDMDNAQITFAVAKESFSTLVAFVSMLLVL